MKKFKLLLTSMVGTSLEFYDLALFGFLGTTIAPIFFPSDDPFISMILTLTAFAVGFIPRPLGAIIFGHIGDKYGRKPALLLSIILMAIPTALIGLMPSYAQIGMFSPILVIALRFLQGICVGGEYNGSSIYFLEHCNPNHRGFFGGLISSSAVLGFFIAALIAIIFTMQWAPDWGWRVPFLTGSLIALFGIYLRRGISETPEFSALNEHSIKKTPILEVLLKTPFSSLCTFGIGACMGCLSLSIFGYMVPYLTNTVGLSSEIAKLINFIAIFWYMLLTPVAGYIADRISPYIVMSTVAITTLLSANFIYTLMASGQFYSVLIGQLLFASLAASFLGPSNAFLFTIFPTSLRYSGVSFNFSLGLALGGSAPVISATLIHLTGNITAPGLYLAANAFVGIISLIAVHKIIIPRVSLVRA